MSDVERKRFVRILLMIAAATAVISLVSLFFFRNGIFTSAAEKAMSILEPFIYGAAIAYLLNPIEAFFERHLGVLDRRLSKKGQGHPGTVRMISILLSLVILFAILILLVLAILPSMVNSISSLVRQIPDAVDRFEQWLSKLDQGETSHEAIGYLQQSANTLVERLQSFLQTTILPNLETYVTNVTSSFMDLVNVCKNFGLGCIVASYLLGGKEKFLAQARLLVYAIFPGRVADWIRDEVHYTDRMFSGFIHGKLLDSLIIGILCYIFTIIDRTPYAVLISVIVGVTNIIPFFGPYMGMIPSTLLILTVSPAKALVFLIFIIILQQFDGNILGPAILGDRMGISGIWILFSILLFGSLWGLVGMLIGVPVFAVLYDIIRKAAFSLLHLRGQDGMRLAYSAQFAKPVQEEKAKAGKADLKKSRLSFKSHKKGKQAGRGNQ